jgi:quercetin dioxygenase-like cupin family protein
VNHQFTSDGDRITPVFDLPLVHRVEAKRIDYEPGGGTPWPHRHPFGAFVYVIEGSVRMGLDDEPSRVLHAGDSFHEPPGALHGLSENASETEPASLLAVFVVPEGQDSAVSA